MATTFFYKTMSIQHMIKPIYIFKNELQNMNISRNKGKAGCLSRGKMIFTQ